MSAHIKAGGIWQEIASPHVKASGAWKDATDGWVKEGGVWKKIHTQVSIVIPTDAIVFYYSTGSAPAGWSEYADAECALRGWHDGPPDIFPESTGGTLAPVFNCASAGAHTGLNNLNAPYYGTTQGYAYCTNTDNVSAGLHGHSCTIAAGAHPPLMRGMLIQALSDQAMLPANAAVFGNNATGFGGLTEIVASNALVYVHHNGGTVGGSIMAENQSAAVTGAEAGGHRHTKRGYTGGTGEAAFYYQETDGVHTHSFNVTDLTWNAQRKFVHAFTAASAFAPQAGMILGWNDTQPPPGWVLCNGQNGTIDLQSYFLCIDSSEAFGDIAGDNTISGSYTTDTKSHNHKGSAVSYLNAVPRYHADDVSHSHSGTISASATFAYIALAFIQPAPA